MDLPSQRVFTNKQLLAMIGPVVAEAVFSSLISMVDGIMVSSVGEAAISAVSLVGSISTVMLVLFNAMTAGGSIVTSQYIGAKKPEEAKQAAGQMLLMTLAASVLLGLICVLFSRQILTLCFGSVEQDVMNDAVVYFTYNAASYPLIAIRSGCGTIFRCSKNTKVSLKVSILANLVNVAGNYICIHILHMGVEGVAIPTVLCRVVSVATIMWMLARSDKTLKPSLQDVTRVYPKTMKKILGLGLPTAVESSLFDAGKVMVMSMISLFGTYQIAASSTATTLAHFAYIPAQACHGLSLTVIGQCVGAKDEAQLKENLRKLNIAAYLLDALVAIPTILLRYQLLGLYDSLSPETVELAADLMLISLGGMMIFYPPAYGFNGPLRAANDTTYGMVVSIVSMMLVRVGLSQILCVQLEWGAIGVWVAMVADWIFRSVFLIPRFTSGVWKKKCGMA